jgi:1,4-dihydroxy-2-naphthoate octaprenyltransferase
MSRVVRGLWVEVRVVPVLLWSFSALTLGTALAGSAPDGWRYAGAVALGVLIQGLLAHSVNEIEDWRSGTDRHPSPRVISGGSKVMVSGLLGERALWWTFAGALAATVGLGLVLVADRGVVVLPFGLLGVAGAIVYTLPPIRAAYRPVAGELLAFACLAACVGGAAVLQDGGDAAVVALAAVAVAGYAVGMLMMHHYLDREADMAASPPKVTTIVALGLARGKVYATAWCAVAFVAAVAAALMEPGLAPLPVAYGVGLAAHRACRPDDVASVTRCELVVVFAGIGGALAAAVVLAPPLAWAALGVAAALAVETAVAPRPRERPAL